MGAQNGHTIFFLNTMVTHYNEAPWLDKKMITMQFQLSYLTGMCKKETRSLTKGESSNDETMKGQR